MLYEFRTFFRFFFLFLYFSFLRSSLFQIVSKVNRILEKGVFDVKVKKVQRTSKRLKATVYLQTRKNILTGNLACGYLHACVFWISFWICVRTRRSCYSFLFFFSHRKTIYCDQDSLWKRADFWRQLRIRSILSMFNFSDSCGSISQGGLCIRRFVAFIYIYFLFFIFCKTPAHLILNTD